MSVEENEACESICKALEGELDGVDVDKIVELKLRRLDREYSQTLAAEIKEQEKEKEKEEEEEKLDDPGWQADFSGTYEACPSDEESVTEEVPVNYSRDFMMTSDKVERIKEIMGKIRINTPYWARNIPDSAFTEMLSKKIINK